MNFCHLHVHTEHSLLDGVSSAEYLVLRAKELGQKYLACTDHGNVDGFLKFQKACKKHDIIPIFGVELYLVPDRKKKQKGEKRYHIIALITNEEGLTNIFKMLSVANLEGFYGRPRIDPETLLGHQNGLIFTSACVGSFINMPGGIDLLLELKRTNTICLEIMPHHHSLQKETNLKKIELSRKYRIPIVATCDVHYSLFQQSLTQEVLLAIQRKKKWTDDDRFTMKDWKLHMRSAEEMELEFATQGVVSKDEYLQAIENTEIIAGFCKEFIIEKKQVSLPKPYGYENEDETELLWKLIKKGFKKRIKSNIDPGPYHHRLNEEMELICRQGFQRYFLIVWELIDWCHKNGIMTGPGRGSVGGSLVAYLLYITDVDPLQYGLLFSRFISSERIDLPDIDMDFEDEHRADVRKHLEDCYGQYNVSGISTFMTMKGRGALRDVSRVFGIDLKEVDRAAKSIPFKPEGNIRPGHTIEDSCKESGELQAFRTKYPEVVRLAIELEGTVRGAGQHAAAVCVSSDDLRLGNQCNFCVRDQKLVANWDKDDAEHMGLMKLDILGLSSLTLLSYAKELIRENYEVEIEFDKIPLDDEKVFLEMSMGHSVGIFQMGTPLLIKLSKDMGVKEFNDFVLLNAISRPGPLASGLTDEFISRKKGLSPIVYIHEKLKPYTEETLGIIIYQEQVMWAMNQLAGLPWNVCDKVRKVVGKSKGAEEFLAFKQQFIDGCTKQKTLSFSEADHVWEQLSSHGSYSFNKSHSVEYSLIGYWTAWLKFNYPKEFMASLLTHGGDDQKSLYAKEAQRLGLQIKLPRLGESLADKWRPSKNKNILYAPFIEIKGIGQSQAEKIVSTPKKKGFFNVSALIDSSQLPKNSSSVDIILHKVGATGRKMTEEELNEIQPYFSFNIRKKSERFKRLYELESRAWSDLPEENLLKCEISGVNLLKFKKYVKKVKCNACPLRQGCKAPVSPSMGRFNVMLSGECPGKEEDLQGIGFVGSAGERILWPEIRKYSLSPLMFHITNVVKCKTKSPTRKQIESCRPILEEEIKGLEPIVILAFGNTNVKFFTGKDSGIEKLTGETEWSDKYQCWICWCIHPAAVLYSSANRKGFERGIENFFNVLNRLGRKTENNNLNGTCPYGGQWGLHNNNYLECEGCEAWEFCAKSIGWGNDYNIYKEG